jgi:cobalt-zinc-cadmium efflux system outer membrane protein
MSSYGEMLCGFIAFALVAAPAASAQSQRALTLPQTLQRALAANPRLTEADREVAMAAGRRLQAGAIPNPEISFELDNAFGTGDLRGLTSAESTLQLSQLIELGGKREARVAAGTAELDATRWERAALRLDIASDTANAFFEVLSEQRRIDVYDLQIAALDRLTPLLQRRVEAGASAPAEVARPSCRRSGPCRAGAILNRAGDRPDRARDPHGHQHAQLFSRSR